MDDQIRELKKLKATMTNPEHVAKVEAAIEQRKKEILEEKEITDTIDFDPFVSA